MGYYISVLQNGKMYELDGQKLEFIRKQGKLFYFYLCKFNDKTFNYEKTEKEVLLELNEIYFIKRFYQNEKSDGLRKIGKDKVFPKY